MQPDIVRRTWSGGAAALACALALAAAVPGVNAATPAPGSLPGASRTPGCTTAGLVVWIDTRGNGTAGSIYYSFELTNLSGHTCTLEGYPGVSAVSLAGRQLGSAAGRNAAHKAGVVTLGNGTTVSATLQIVAAGNFPPASCRPTTAAGLRVYPPNETVSKFVPFPFSACSRPGVIFLTVGAVQRT